MKYLYVLLIIGLYINVASADTIDQLLQDYKEASELSKKTKDENRGHLTIFTRDDLERMQVETLKDLLKSLRFSRYLENRLGDPDLFNSDPLVFNSKSIRIYINEHEMVIPATGSGFFLFGDIDLDFVDHVEIYQGFPSFDFAIEPASVVVKLYTKSAERDAGSRIKGLVASRGSHKENLYTAGFTKESDVAYFLYLNHTKNNRQRYRLDANSLSRDQKKDHLYASLGKGNHMVEMQAIFQKSDTFLGSLPYAVPKNTYADRKFFNLAYSYLSSDKSISLHASYILSHMQQNDYYQPALPPVLGGYSRFERDKQSAVLTLLAKKKYTVGRHAMAVGAQYRDKSFILDDYKIDNLINPFPQKYDQEKIYSLFLEDNIALSESDLLGISLMQQHYRRNREMKDVTIPQVRLSYIHANEHFTAKTFYSSREMMPERIMTASAHVGNPDLSAEKVTLISQEFDYRTGSIDSKVVVGKSCTKGYLYPGNRGIIQNSEKDLGLLFTSFEIAYQFRENDRLRFAWNRVKISGKLDMSLQNYTFQMLNTIGRFDLFNELVINQGEYGVDDSGYDYSAGIRYRATKDLHIELKGENIFDSGLTRKYWYSVPTLQTEVPVVERKFMLSLEYLF